MAEAFEDALKGIEEGGGRFGEFLDDVKDGSKNPADLAKDYPEFKNFINKFKSVDKIEIKGADGKIIDPAELKKYLEPETVDPSGKVYNTGEFLKKLGADDKFLEDNKARIQTLDTKLNNGSYATEIKKGTEIINNAKKLKSPKSSSELENLKAENTKLKERLDQLEKDVKSGKTPLGYGRTALYVFGTGLASLTIYELVETYRRKINGCWLVSTTDPNKKCKIYPLTCGDDYKTDGTLKCNYYTKNGDDPFSFNPCLTGSVAKDTTANYPGNYNDTTGFCDNCITKVTAPTVGVDNCVKPCISSDSACSDKCSTDNFDVPSGYVLQCNNFNWMEALGHASDNILNGLSEPGGFSLIQILIWIFYGIIIIVVLGVVFGIVMGFKNVFKFLGLV